MVESWRVNAARSPELTLCLNDLKISATCTRVPVIDGHTAIVSMEFGENIPSLEKIVDIWRNYRSLPQLLNLPSAPISPIIYREEDSRHTQRRERTSFVSAGKLNVRLVGRRHEKPLWTHEIHLAVVLDIEVNITQKDWIPQLIAPAMPEKEYNY